MEVFVGYSSDEQAALLIPTFEAWAQFEDFEPVGILVKEGKFEIQRRVTADKLSKGRFYILADLGCVPDCDVNGLGKKLKAEYGDSYGIVGFACGERELKVPTGVRVCQKGVVSKWAPNQSGSYDQEYASAVESAGYKVAICPSLPYKHLLAC